MANSLDEFEKEYENEKTFIDVAKKSLRFLYLSKDPPSYFLVYTVLIFPGYMIIYSSNTLTILEKIVTTTISLSATLLGFLIAGFAVYSAMLDKNLVNILISRRNTKTNYSDFHTYYLYFFEPFVIYFITLILSLLFLVLILTWPEISRLIPSIVEYKYYACIIIGLYLFIIFLCVISLKDFIFNIYTIAIMFGRVEFILQGIGDKRDEVAKKLRERGGNSKK